MATQTTSSSPIRTLADLLSHLGVAPDRVRFRPSPGQATLQDVVDIERREGVLCELIDGVLVEKVMAWNESSLAGFLLSLLNAFVIPRNLGIITGADGKVELAQDLVRIPDVAFTSWSRLPNGRRPTAPIPRLAPNLAVEVLCPSNTAREMVTKRDDYFTAGVELVWQIDLRTRTVAVYTSPTQVTTLGENDTLTGGAVLPGFQLPLQQLFGELDRAAQP